MCLWLHWHHRVRPGYILPAVSGKGGNPILYSSWPMIWDTGTYPVMARRNFRLRISIRWPKRGCVSPTTIRGARFVHQPGSVIRLGNWKLHEYFEDSGIELYDLESDIGEKQNLSGKHPDLARNLQSRLVAWRREIGVPVPSIPNPDYDHGYDIDQQAKRRARFR